MTNTIFRRSSGRDRLTGSTLPNGGQAAGLELRLTGGFVVQDVLDQVAVARRDVPLVERLDAMERPVRTLEGEQGIPPVGGRLHVLEFLERIMVAVGAGEARSSSGGRGRCRDA